MKMKYIAALAAAVAMLGLLSAPASGVTAMQCQILGKHLTNGHCCLAGQSWNGTGNNGGCCPNGMSWRSDGQCVQPALGIEDPGDASVKTTLCKAKGTC